MTAPPQYRAQLWLPHPFRLHREGWVSERSETALNLNPAATSKVEVDSE